MRFEDEFAVLYHEHFPRLARYLGRLGGDADLAADLAQEAFVRLYRRGQAPDTPGAWLVTVATNLLRNARSTRSRRARLLTPARGADTQSDPPPSPAAATEAEGERRRVRATLDQLPERDQQLLLLRAEGYSYHELARILGLNEASVGTLLARARTAFRERWEGTRNAP